MAIKAILETLDGVEDSLKTHYVEKDGKFFLEVNEVDGFTLENTKNLRSALSKERSDKEEALRSVKAFGDLTPDEVKSAMEKAKDFENMTPKEQVDKLVEERTAGIKTKLESDMSALQNDYDRLKTNAENTFINSAIQNAISKSEGKVVPGAADMLIKSIRESVAVSGEGDSASLKILNEKGEPRISAKPGESGDMGLQEFVDSYASNKDFAFLYQGSGQSGSGPTNQGNNGNNGNGNGNLGKISGENQPEGSSDPTADYVSKMRGITG